MASSGKEQRMMQPGRCSGAAIRLAVCQQEKQMKQPWHHSESGRGQTVGVVVGEADGATHTGKQIEGNKFGNIQ